MPKQRRRGASLLISFWLLALMSSVAVVGGMGRPGDARADEGDPSAEPSESSTSDPTEEPPEIECGPDAATGPVPPGEQSITGTVTNGANPVAGIEVSLRSTTYGSGQTTTTNGQGQYSFDSALARWRSRPLTEPGSSSLAGARSA